mmetsp:Transcript_29203/g.47049  ORF Transcript_29203/g.47049 Transcript_29203/m.47049 type:complete len:222 (-) Transcript_29203:224-889(-)
MMATPELSLSAEFVLEVSSSSLHSTAIQRPNPRRVRTNVERHRHPRKRLSRKLPPLALASTVYRYCNSCPALAYALCQRHLCLLQRPGKSTNDLLSAPIQKELFHPDWFHIANRLQLVCKNSTHRKLFSLARSRASRTCLRNLLVDRICQALSILGLACQGRQQSRGSNFPLLPSPIAQRCTNYKCVFHLNLQASSLGFQRRPALSRTLYCHLGLLLSLFL